MRGQSHTTAPLIVGILLISALALSGCASAVVGVGTAAVAASTTEKGFSTSVSDGVIFAKLKDRFIQVNAALLTGVDVTVNDGAVLFTGNSLSDAGVGALCARTAVIGAYFNVRINAKDIKDRSFAKEILFKAKGIYDQTNKLEKEMIEFIDTKI